jgi:hypothetical protein
VKQLRRRCDERTLKFKTTAELAPLEGTVGQDRAVSALDFVLHYDSGSYDNNGGQDWHVPISGGASTRVYVMDGTLDPGIAKAATHAGVDLYLDWNGSELYVATQAAGGAGNDVFAFVAGVDGEGSVRVASAAGEAIITREATSIRYAPLSGDPLELGASFAGDRDAWLGRTFDSAFPDAPVHLLDQFSSPRAGDLVVAAREGYDFRKAFEIPEHKSGHGSLIRTHMHTPLWTNRPVPDAPMRTADVFPALLDWLDVTVPDGIDGRALWQPGSAARAHASRRRTVPAQAQRGT